MTNAMDRAVVVTGASTGIGRAAVAEAVRQGAHVFPAVRKKADADALKAEFGKAVTPVIFDVTDEAAVRKAAAVVDKALAGRTLFGLVNNAGVAVPGPLAYLSSEDLRHQMEVNFTGVHMVTQAFLPLLGIDPDRKGAPGKVVMITSVAGEAATPFIGAYAASKHAVEGYAEALRREMILFGIDVVVVAPGAIATPIWDKVDERQVALYANTPYAPMLEKVRDLMIGMGRKGLPPAQVGALVWRVLSRRGGKVRHRILRSGFFQITLPRFLPARVVDKAIAGMLGINPAR